MIKWKKKIKRDWREGDIRVVRRFLLWPVCIEDEWRWLGLSLIKQMRIGPRGDFDAHSWINMEWVDKPRPLKGRS